MKEIGIGDGSCFSFSISPHERRIILTTELTCNFFLNFLERYQVTLSHKYTI